MGNGSRADDPQTHSTEDKNAIATHSAKDKSATETHATEDKSATGAYFTEEESIIKARERRIAEARQLTLFSDVFMTTALKDKPACQHVLCILTGDKDLKVNAVRTQYRISNITSRDAVLDVFAEDGGGRLMNIEVQRADTVDHARRTRFYGSMIDSEYLQKGKTYSEMPDVHILYISLTDLWKAGKTVYPVKKYFEGTNVAYDDGQYIMYVNAEVDDGTEIAQLMQYFKTTDPEDGSQGDLSKRIHFLKSEKGGEAEMCEVSEKWYREGMQIGEQRGEQRGEMKKARETAYELDARKMPPETIADIIKVSIETVKEWLAERPATAV